MVMQHSVQQGSFTCLQKQVFPAILVGQQIDFTVVRTIEHNIRVYPIFFQQ